MKELKISLVVIVVLVIGAGILFWIQSTKEPKTVKAPAQQKTVSTYKNSEIIQYIRGGELDTAKLIEYKSTKGISQKLKNSIQLCLDFWALDGSGSGKKSKTYWNLRDKVNADDNLHNSKLKAFIDKMSQEGATPSYSNQDKKRGLK
jgi:ribosomal protein L22